MDNHQFLRNLSNAFSDLNTPFAVFNNRGQVMYSSIGNQPVQIPEQLSLEQPTSFNGGMFMLLDIENGLLIMTPDSSSAADTIRMASVMIKLLYKTTNTSQNINNAYLQLLEGSLAAPAVDALVNEFKIPKEMLRCILLAYASGSTPGSADLLLRNALPLDSNDVIVPVDKHTVAIIKYMASGTTIEELDEFASAAQETMLSEEGLRITIGIGEPGYTIQSLATSYEQAKRAVEIGRIFHPAESIFIHRKMMLERLMSDIPPEIAASYHSMLFNRKTSRLFSDEMLETINMFLKKDLNLSDTARQLYIHRNTLVYRLEKVQKQTGLDLRHFDDAVTFKLLFEIRKRTDIKNSLKHAESKERN